MSNQSRGARAVSFNLWSAAFEVDSREVREISLRQIPLSQGSVRSEGLIGRGVESTRGRRIVAGITRAIRLRGFW